MPGPKPPEIVLLPPLQGRNLLEGVPTSTPGGPIIVVGSPVRDGKERICGGLFVSIESGREFTRLLDLGRAGLTWAQRMTYERLFHTRVTGKAHLPRSATFLVAANHHSM